jgi:hypothetical protein
MTAQIKSAGSISTSTVRTTRLPSGEAVPVLGLGTWHLAENPRQRKDELAALRLGLDLGVRLIDTAEMYADGGAEGLVGEAIRDRRDDVFLVSKVLPEHATIITHPRTITAATLATGTRASAITPRITMAIPILGIRDTHEAAYFYGQGGGEFVIAGISDYDDNSGARRLTEWQPSKVSRVA